MGCNCKKKSCDCRSVITKQGVQGVQGPLGPPGRKGDPGTVGATGADGADGLNNIIVQDEGVVLPVQPNINFTGTGVNATNDIPNNAIKVTIPGQIFPTYPVDINIISYTIPNNAPVFVTGTNYTVPAGQGGLYELYFSGSIEMLLNDPGASSLRFCELYFRKNTAVISTMIHKILSEDAVGIHGANITFYENNLILNDGDTIDVFAFINVLTNINITTGKFVVKRIKS